LALLAVSGGAVAQTPAWLEAIAPGFDTIASNPVEYKKVLDKFSEAQFRPSVRDCAIAYYGFPMQSAFAAATAATTSTDEDNMQRAIMADDYATAYTLGTQILERTPVSLTTLYWTLYAAIETGLSWEVRNSLLGRYNSISYIVSLSGDGIAPGSAFKVVSRSDMYTYTMLELGLEIGEGYLWDGRWTEFEVTQGAPGRFDTPDRVRPAGTRFNHPSIFFELWDGQ
jgi:hypothetical protein